MNNRFTNRSLRDGGFSLLECIVALALLALLMALLPSTIRMAKRASAFATQLSGASAIATSMVAVERLLREATPQIERNDTGALRIAFDGQHKSLSFVAPLSDGPYGACLCQFVVESVQSTNPERRNITLTSRPWTAADPSRAETSGAPQQRTLTIGAGDVSFRYYGVAPSDATPQWHDAWLRNDRLPDLVEIDLPKGARSGTRPAPVVVELMLRRPR